MQADLQTLAHFQVEGMGAVTLVTAQNRWGIADVHLLPPRLVARQIACAWEAHPPQALKIGALGSGAIVEAVAEELKQHMLPPVVLDPVLESSSGYTLLETEAIQTLVKSLFPLATLITPNIPEAQRLLGSQIEDERGMQEATKRLWSFGAQAVLLKGGHAKGPESVDILYDGRTFHRFALPRISASRERGTGCRLAAGIAALMAQGAPLVEAVQGAKKALYARLQKNAVS